MYVLLTDAANILKVRLVYIIRLSRTESARVSLLGERSANAYTSLAFRSIFSEEGWARETGMGRTITN